MSIVRRLSAVLLLGAACGGVTQAAPAVTLKIGDPAPAMQIAKWVKGPAIDLNDGKVNVVEFWATWCDPCKEGMPHLSNLAAKYRGQVGFAGVSVWENGEDQLARVEKFVAHAGDSMAYSVAFSGEGESAMARSWPQAAGVRGIPAAFIIDKHGKVAWIGSPGEGMEDALELALQDRLTPASAARVDAAYKSKLKGMDELKRKIEAAAKAADVAGLRERVREATDIQYSAAASIVPDAYVTLANASPQSATAFADQILQDYGNAPRVMMAVANAISGADNRIRSKPDLAFASRALARVAATSEVDQDFNLLFARVSFQAGDLDSAIKAQTAALEWAQSFLKTVEKFDTSQNAREREAAPVVQKGAQMQVEAYRKTLDEYKAAAAAAKTPRLNIGAQAPALKVDRWYKGTPVAGFAPGRIYVVEFWATWCVPCKEAMPHLTELARKHQERVTVIGISVAENGDDIPARIGKFVAGMGDDMGYAVAGDSPDGHMYRNWLQAAGENSIPASIVVDGQGKVAWIGTPAGLEKPLQQLIAGTFDPKAALQAREDEKSGVAAYRAAEARINRVIAAKDFDGAVAAIHEALATRSEFNYMLMMMVMPGLMELDEKRAAAELKSLLSNSEYHDAVSQSAMMLVELDTLSAPTYEMAIEEIHATRKRSPENAFGYHMLAMGYSRLGEMEKAVELQQTAIRELGKDPKATAQDREDFAAKLAQYQSQAAGPDEHPVSWKVTSEQVGPLTYRIKCEATIRDPFHIYPQGSSGVGIPTEFRFAPEENVELVGAVEERGREKKPAEEAAYYARGVTFIQTVKLKAARRTDVSFTVKFQACNEVMCLPPATKQFTLTVDPN